MLKLQFHVKILKLFPDPYVIIGIQQLFQNMYPDDEFFPESSNKDTSDQLEDDSEADIDS